HKAQEGNGDVCHLERPVHRIRHRADRPPVAEQPEEEVHGVDAVPHGGATCFRCPLPAPWHLEIALAAVPGGLAETYQWAPHRVLLDQVLEVLGARAEPPLEHAVAKPPCALLGPRD